ncbi:MAG: orotidine 5'-phosphate decarboxylase / HUMPS family protein [Candidatus Heimdallarchaeaceae archaeon]
MSLTTHNRYVQIAFNGTARQVRRILPQIPQDSRIIIEAGTPYIKRTGMAGVHLIRRYWRGLLVADIKVTDGAAPEVIFSAAAGANAATVMGSAPVETLDFFIQFCAKHNMISMIDMLGVDNPLRKMLPMKHKPDVIVIHKGRDEETDKSNIIRYKDIVKIRSKYDSLMAVAGGLQPDDVRRAYFNGADIAILNVIGANDPNAGLHENENFRQLIPAILAEVGH